MLFELTRGKLCANLIRQNSLKIRYSMNSHIKSIFFSVRNPMIKSESAEPKRIQPNQIATLNRFDLRPYPQKYPTLIVRGDGSTYRVWSTEEPQEIVRFPIDVSNMSEMDRTRLLRLVYIKNILLKVILANDMENRLKRVSCKV